MKTLDLYITNICNLNCEYCYVDLQKKEIPFDRERFFERVQLQDYDHIKFFGGEPLIKWKEIQKIILMPALKGKKFTIVTNGLLLDYEIITFCLKNKIEIVISMHFKSIKQILPKISRFSFANSILGFSFVIEPDKIYFAYKIISLLIAGWFTNFILTPEVYSDWNEKNIDLLHEELKKFFTLFQYHPQIKFTGPSKDMLPELIRGCNKSIVNKTGERMPCNRFKSLHFFRENNIKKIYSNLNAITNYDNDPDKWFYICPIGWYLDTLSSQIDLNIRLQQYQKLNQLFINFYRKINTFEGKINFLTEKIDEIRFNLTSQCNIRCEYCYVDFKDTKLDIKIAKNIVNFLVLKEWNNKTISFFGGEPLLEFELLVQIVEYAKQIFSEKGKSINFRIATNFLLINEERMNFLRENNFEIHISLNGNKKTNDAMRFHSTNALLHNFNQYLTEDDKGKIVILLAFSNREISILKENITYITELGFTKINLELIFGKKYFWTKEDFTNLAKEFLRIKNSLLYNNLEFYNFLEPTHLLDISVDGRCSDNSLEFHKYDADFNYQKIFKKLFLSIFKNTKIG